MTLILSQPRPYRDEHDFQAMLALLQAGRQADNGTYTIHTGDLSWWLYYPPLDNPHWPRLQLWDNPDQPGQLLGWSLVSPEWMTFDVYVQPWLRGTPQAEAMFGWAEAQAADLARTRGEDKIRILWVAQDDEVVTAYLTRRGFRRTSEDCVYMARLDEMIPSSSVPEGFVVRACRGEAEVEARAMAQYGAFESTLPRERYIQRWRDFMRSPVYNPELDVVAAASDGRIGAFCIVWPDRVNQVGLFEPVGVHPDFRRRGLGKAVMLEGLHRLRRLGMRRATLCTAEDNLPAVRLYQAVGFQTINKWGTYEKTI